MTDGATGGSLALILLVLMKSVKIFLPSENYYVFLQKFIVLFCMAFLTME